MTNIPLISKVWKNNRGEITEEELAEKEQSVYQQAVKDLEEEQELERGLDPQALPDDARYQFFGGNVFAPHTLEGATISRMVLPSSATSYHTREISLAVEIHPFLGRILKMQESIALKWAKRLEKNRDFYFYGDKQVDKKANIFMEVLYLTVYKQDQDNKTRLSYEMAGLKEVNTMRKDIERGERKPKLDEQIGVRR
jgi:hypothetical protein